MKLSLIDFKNVDSKEYTIEGNTEILGLNGSGKTAILEAILFALYGRNFSGGVATDRFVRYGSKCATVTLSLSGTEIKRTTGGDDSGVYLNGSKSKVAEVGSLFPPFEGGYAAINPLYFIFDMSEKSKRDLFMKLLPAKDREEIFKTEFSDRKDLVDRFKSMNLKSVREQIKNYEAVRDANRSLISQHNIEIETDKMEIARIREQAGSMPDGVLNREKETQIKLNSKREELLKMGNPLARVEEYKTRLSGIIEEISPALVKLGVKNITEAVDKLASMLEESEAKSAELLKEYTENEVLLENLKMFENGVCPTCGQVVEKAIKTSSEVESKLEELSGEREVLSTKIVQIKGLHSRMKELSNEVKLCKNGIETHSSKIDRYERLKTEVENLDSQLRGDKEAFERAVEIEKSKEIIKRINNDIMRRKGTIARLQSTLEKIENDMPDLRLLESAFKPSGVDAIIAKQQALDLEKMLSKYLDIKIETVKTNKTNDKTREVFEIYLGDVEFSSLSFGQKILLAVAFSLVLRKLIFGFNLDFILIDEASVLSKSTFEKIVEWCNEANVQIICTKATDSKLIMQSL